MTEYRGLWYHQHAVESFASSIKPWSHPLTINQPNPQSDLSPLSQLAIGERGIVQRVNVTGPVRRRFLDLGLVTGAEVTLVQIAPMGDPIAFELRGYRLSLRKTDAGQIWVKRVSSIE